MPLADTPDLAREGTLTRIRIRELIIRPVVGNFDEDHLREVHRRIFQDLPHHRPGEIRPDAPGHQKYRALESSSFRYPVAYALRLEIDTRLGPTLAGVKTDIGLRSPDTLAFSERMAKLYADLDHLHPFSEGNSRTLRSFTRQLALEVGKRKLDWGTSGADAHSRDNLYQARDFEVIKRTYPGIAAKDATTVENRGEMGALLALGQIQKADRLTEIVRQSVDYGSLSPDQPLRLTRASALATVQGLLPYARHQAAWDEERTRVAANRDPRTRPAHERAEARLNYLASTDLLDRSAAQLDKLGGKTLSVPAVPGERAIDRVLIVQRTIERLSPDPSPSPPPERVALAEKWRSASAEDRAADPDLRNAQSRYVAAKAAITASSDNEQTRTNLTAVARETIGVQIERGKIYLPQNVASPAPQISGPSRDNQQARYRR